jgi:thiol-disulfide isomerase/thioredoxin
MKRLLFPLLFLLLSVEAQSQDIPVMDFDGLAPMLQMENDTLYMVNFWATWCMPCVQEMPDIVRFADEMKERKFRLILVSLDDPGQMESRVKPFVKRNGIEGKVILLDDPDANSWIPKVHPDWMGAIPATLFYSSGFRRFHGEMIDYTALKEIVEPVLITK